MTICELCEQEKRKAYSCLKRMAGQIPFGDEKRVSHQDRCCPDCGVGGAGFHHPGCNIEDCPACRGKLALCVCEVPQDYHSLTTSAWWGRLPRVLGDVFASQS